MIKLFIEILLIGIYCIIFIPQHKIFLIRFFGVGTLLISFFSSLFIWLFFGNSTYKLQFVTELAWLPQSNINLTVGVDGISLFFLLLSTLLIPSCLLSFWSSVVIPVKFFFIAFLLQKILLILVFSVSDLLLFYIFFESLLVPQGRSQDKSLFNFVESGKKWNIDFILRLTKRLLGLMTSSENCFYMAHGALAKLTEFKFAKASKRVFNFNNTYLNTLDQHRGSKLRYLVSYRSFSYNYKSGAIVADKSPLPKKFAASEQKLLLAPIICEVRQMYLKKESEALHKVFNNKIHRASKKVQAKFTFDNIQKMFYYLEDALTSQSFTGYYKYNLNNLLSNPCFLLYCYSQLKVKKAVNTNALFIENVTLLTILALSTKLIYGIYKPKPISRTFIPKANGKMRPLAIASNTDKLVQKTIFIFLDPIFENFFLKCSHGFRKNRNCHTSLSSIYYNWVGTKWFIEADFSNCFDRNSHPILMGLITKKFHNYQVSRIIHSLLNVGYINFGATLTDSELEHSLGTPQGSLLSPLFCNILLHELDSFSISLCNKVFNAKRGISSEWLKVWRRYLNTPWEDVWHLIKSKVDNVVSAAKINKAMREIRIHDVTFKSVNYYGEDEHWRRLTYTRYADDFLFGYIGPKKEAVSILIAVNHFVDLFLGMRLNVDKTRVRHHEKGVYFLGYKIWKKYGLTVTWGRNSLGYKHRNESTRLNFSVPLEKLFQRYAERGFIIKAKKKKINKYVGKRQDKWLFFTDDASIIQRFNSVLKGIANYYTGATQQGILGKLYYVLKKSAALTIAHRNSKRNAAWALKKYGKEMLVKSVNKQGKESFVELFKPKAQKVNWQGSYKGQLNNMLAIPSGVPIRAAFGVLRKLPVTYGRHWFREINLSCCNLSFCLYRNLIKKESIN